MLIAAVLLAQTSVPPPVPDPRRYLLVNSDRALRKSLHKPVAPGFPEDLRTAAQVTTVLVDAFVDSQGQITRASVIKGDARAHVAALRAAMQWGFEPPEGKASALPVRLSFTFRTLPTTASAKELEPDFSEKYGVEVRARVATAPSEP